LSEKHKEEVNQQIRKMLQDIISPSESMERVTTDFKKELQEKLNELIIGDLFPLPNIIDSLDQLGNAKYFSTLDLASGYHQIPMSKEYKNKTAFSTSHGHYEFNRI